MNKGKKCICAIGFIISLGALGYIFYYYIDKLYQLPNSDEIKKIVFPLIILTIILVTVTLVFLVLFEIFQIRGFRRVAYFSHDAENFANTTKFLIIVKKRITKKDKENHGYIISLGIDDFTELRLSVLTLGETLEIVNTISAYLKKYNTLNDRKSFCAYDENGSFNLYFERKTQKEAIDETISIIEDLKLFFKEKSYSSSLEFRAGMCELTNKNQVREITDNASIARYYNSKNNLVDLLLYDPIMRKEIREVMKTKAEIERALINNEFEVYYQPKFNIKLNRFVGAEALVRWHHPEKGFLHPGAFIPFAEQTGQIVDIDRYVFEQVCKDIVSWKENKTRLMMISVNLSKNEIFKTDVVKFYKDTITKYHVSPLLIEIEITESMATKDMLYTSNVLEQLKSLRFTTSMDDFGTGYSSLSCLKKMPVDTLKLDKTFFDEIEIDKRSRDIVYTTIKLAKALEMNVIAEGIQTEKQVQFLKTTDCDCIQGYYYSKPISKSEYESFLRKNKFE